MNPYYYRGGNLRMHFTQEGAVGGILYAHDEDTVGLALNREDLQDLVSRIRALEVGYDRWGQLLPLRRGAIIFDRGRTRYRADGKYPASPTSFEDILGLADAIAGYFDHRRFKCKWCGESVDQDSGARAYHPKCRKQKANHDYHQRVRRPRLDALKASN